MEGVRWVQHLFGPEAYPVFVALTYLGSSLAIWGLIALVYWLVEPRFGRQLAVVVGAGFVINQLLKVVIGTPRPYEHDPSLATRFAVSTGGGGGFPSGHTQNAAEFWPSLALRHRRGWLWAAALLLVVAVAASRLYLGVHSPEDVIGGAVIGGLLAAYGPALARPLPGRRVWGAGVAALGLALALTGLDARGLGFLAGALIAVPAFRPPRTLGRGLAFALGGAVLVGLGGLAFTRGLPGRWADAAGMVYLRFLALTLLAAEGWPRLALRSGLVSRMEEREERRDRALVAQDIAQDIAEDQPDRDAPLARR